MLTGMPITFVGDVHGWRARLDRVVEAAVGELVFMGDLIDRGPDSPAVLDRVRNLCEGRRARCLLGNHEYTLVRALGVPGTGFAPDLRLFEAWKRSFGGQAVMTAYGVKTPEALTQALGDHLPWLVSLPWILRGEEGARRWIAVHAGLGEEPWEPQVQRLERGWAADDGNAAHLFNKAWAQCVPADLPADCCVVSGHTPVRQALVLAQRILCDTSGGLPDRLLSAVVWPDGNVITS
jgi:Calcineurin-like phosphoesterase